DAVLRHLDPNLKNIIWGDDEEALDQTQHTQPALFAVEVALHRLAESWGLKPDFVAGHSIGEIAAAHIAGVFSLEDAAKLITARATLMQNLPPGGVMIALQATEDEVTPHLTEGVSIAAVNGPTSIVIAGTETAAREVAKHFEKTKQLRVSHAFHSPLMEPMLDEFRAAIAGIAFEAPIIPLISNLTGEQARVEHITTADYWVSHVREAVRFADGINWLTTHGVTQFVEIGPDGILSALVEEGATPLLRKGRNEVEAITTALANLHVRGTKIDWSAYFAHTNAKRVDLPTYAFQTKHYWPKGGGGFHDPRAAGLGAARHPLLTATVSFADQDGALLTGRLTRQTHPWLVDHAVRGAVLLPGTAYLELAIRAGDEVGCDRVEELTLTAPLIVPERGGVQVQLWIGNADANGRRTVKIYSRAEGSDDEPWTQHAIGVLGAPAREAAFDTAVWPPAGATALDTDGCYENFAAMGFEYGPVFQGLRRAWRAEDGVVYAEVSLPEGVDPAGFGLHPALLDSALHAALISGEGEAGLPFSWEGVSLHATGASTLRVRLTRFGDNAYAIAAVDGAGKPVASVDSLVVRAVAAESTVDRDSLFQVDWVPVTVPAVQDSNALVISLQGNEDVVASVHELTERVLGLLQEERDERVVFVTNSTDLASAAVWGMVRSAQSESPGRFSLIELDGTDASNATLAAAVASEEPQLALRNGEVYAPRLARADIEEAPIEWGAKVLITGGTGGLGKIIAKHLVTEHGVRELVLVSRRGTGDVSELESLGASVSMVACDVTDADAVAALVSAHEITAVVHSAGVLDDGVISSLTPERLHPVLAPKVDAAWNLHVALPGVPLVLFSSLAGTWGTAGQANYAAGNHFLDALAEFRRSTGAPAVSLAWGAWAGDGMLTEADAERMTRTGMPPLTVEQGLGLFDRAVASTAAALVPARLDLATLRQRGEVPPLLRGLIRVRTRRAASGSETADTLIRRLAGLGAEERSDAVLELVRGQVAAVLGHASGDEIEPTRQFQDLGFDSLTAVELRNQLTAVTGLRLPATMVFDYPTPVALSSHLLDELFDGAADVVVPVQVRAAVSDDPIVIVGMGCRYPDGIGSADDLWRLVSEGGDAVSGLPSNRGWDLENLYHPDPDHPGTTYSRSGGFLHDAGEFDAGFFGMSPREALGTDSQQRILLEVVWEAIEHAGIDPVSLRGTQTGVFAGVMYNDYGARLAGGDFEGFQGSGTSPSIVSGRVSYTLGLEGPAVTVDTACSSSLVAMHWAMQALRAGECSLALAGGVTVMSTPTALVEFSRQRGLSPDGRCKAFSDSADGVGWSEGAGVVVLERLSDAQRNGHPVLAVIRGSAVNQDGASNGLMAPNGPAQQRVIRAALANAGLASSDVDVVEAHGTGTTLGDPIEAQALLATYGQNRTEPLLLGSVKSNMGHTQAAAGVAGVIKMVQAMRHGVVPQTLHVTTASSHVDWTEGAVELLTSPRSWPAVSRPRRAGVSSFGISGTNAHVIIEQPPAADVPGSAPSDVVVPVVLSGRTRRAVRGQAARLRSFVESSDVSLHDLAFSLATTRSAFEQRAAIVANDRETLLRSLGALATENADAAVVEGEVAPGKVAFLFSGQGSQRLGMGQELHARYPVFAAALDEVLERLPVREVMWGSSEEDLRQTGNAQLALFAFEVALFRLVRSWGVKVNALVGHSIGEIAAAHVAGVLSLDDACALVSARARLMQALPAGGAMVAIQATEAEVTPLLTAGVSIAAINGPDSVTVAGVEQEVLAVVTRFDDRKTRQLSVSHAFHSPLMEPMLDEFRAVVAGLSFATPSIPLHTSGDVTSPDYWVSHVREAVRFHDNVEAARAAGVTTFVEIGPEGALSALVDGAIPVLRKDRSEEASVALALGRLFTTGVSVDWKAYYGPAHRVALPTYAFQHEYYWPLGSAAPVITDADPADAKLWAAIERGDARELAALLRLGEEQSASLDSLIPALSSWRAGNQEKSLLDSWRYRVLWAPVRITGTPVLSGHVTVLTTPVVDAEPYRAVLAAHGAEVTVVTSIADIPECDLVVSLVALDESPAQVLTTGLEQSILLVKSVDVPIWAVTSGAVAAETSDSVRSAAQAAVWGFGRAAALEHPQRWAGLIDMPEVLDENALRRFVSCVAGLGGEDQLAVRSSGVLGRRLAHRPVDALPSGYTAHGTVLITGGTGGLGATTAKWLAERGVSGLVLTSRRGIDAPGAAELKAALEELGPQVSIVACDVADRDALSDVIEGISDLSGVVHTAGAAQHAPLELTSLDDFADVLSAKVIGAANLDALVGEVDFFVLFGSIAGVWGSGGQAAYGAANAYCDALAEARRARGLRATSIAWGPWAEVGMATHEAMSDNLARRGLTFLQPDQAVAELNRAVMHDDTCVTVVDINWDTYFPLFTSVRPSALLADLPEVRALTVVEEVRRDDSEFARTLRSLSEEDQKRKLVELVRAEAAATLGHSSVEEVGENRAFRDIGFDSLTAVELRKKLSDATGLSLPATLVFDYPTPVVLADHLLAELLGSAEEALSYSAQIDSDEPIAIVGMSCRFPGDANTPEAFWEMVLAGTDAITEFPADRGFDMAQMYDPDPDRPGTTYTTAGGYLPGAGDFDPSFFGISPREATGMDPQQRLLLETTWEAVERAGIDPAALRGKKVGAFIGSSYIEYGGGDGGSEGYQVTGTSPSVLSGRVAYVFGFEGPAVTVDTACSSSLVAMHLACQSLRTGESAFAVAGGATIMPNPKPLIAFSRQRALARDGRCKSFSDSADGMILSEGIGMLLLMRQSDAVAAGHRVLAVIRGSAVNQDGASNGLSAPNGPSQQRVIMQALANSGVATNDIDALDAHGTGTSLGDPIEAQALFNTYGRDRDADRPLFLGSVKSNIGHTQSAAGVASVIKMVMALQHGVLPRTLHAAEPSTHVDWTPGTIALLQDTTQWPETGRARRCAVSSFGISGTNAHVILEQAAGIPPFSSVPNEIAGQPGSPQSVDNSQPVDNSALVDLASPELPASDETIGVGTSDSPRGPQSGSIPTPWLVSAKSEAALRAQIDGLANVVARPEDIAYSLSLRPNFDHRAVLIDGAETRGVADLERKVAFIFPGQGSQWVGMGAQLLDESPIFAARMAECAAALQPHTDWNLLDVIRRAESLDRVDVVQPASWAMMVSLAELWKHYGVTPDADTWLGVARVFQ
ncbi:type I polyketide synthase, partial [Lentzea sp. NPDC006480]|uniref:type I polyketide synthase n=1 Tax=Lentzea sp. NPDC006480 TaxID=3157176 RepID=UPI0033AF518A